MLGEASRDNLDKWLSFLTEPLPASDSATPEALREHAATVIDGLMVGAVQRGLLDDRVVLAQFVQVEPEKLALDFGVSTVFSRSHQTDLIQAVSHQLSHVSESDVSVFKRFLLRERTDEQRGDVLVLAPRLQTFEVFERFDVRSETIPSPEPLLRKIPPVDSSKLSPSVIDDAGTRIACRGIKSLIRPSASDLTEDVAEGADSCPPFLVDLLGEAEAARRYLWNIAPLALNETGQIVIVVPRVHRGDRPLTERLGGGGCLYVVLGELDRPLLSLLYALTFRLSSAAVDLSSVARALDQGATYRRVLQVFGHDVGRLLQESSLPSLANHSDRKVRLAARRLYVARGIGEATRVLKDVGSRLPPDWIAEPGTSVAAEASTLGALLRDVCSFYLFADESLPPEWKIEWRLPEHSETETVAQGRARELSAVDGVRPVTKGLPPLPGLAHANATAALTFGLAELLRNARKGLGDNRAVFAADYRTHQLGPAISVSVVDSKGAVTITIDSLHLIGSPVASDTIDGIQSLEATCLTRSGQALIRSSQFAVLEAITPRVQRIRATWTYNYARALA